MKPEDLLAITDQELLFCEEYLQDGNAIRAAMAADLATVPIDTATDGDLHLGKDQIQTWLKYLKGRQAKCLNITIPKILREYAIIARADVENYVLTEEGRLDVKPGLPKSLLRAVKRWKIVSTKTTRNNGASTTRTVMDIEMRDKHPAFGWLLEYFKDLPSEDDGKGTTHAKT